MKIFNEVCLATSSAGHRRGAQMGVIRCDHPDVLEFIHAKHDQETLSGFNMSVAVTDEFMEALDKGSTYQLRFGGQDYGELDTQEVWEAMMRSTWDWAEPGVLFIDTINRLNNLRFCETIAATNPCAEQCLPPNGACLLGSFNLAKYIYKNYKDTYGSEVDFWYEFDWAQLKEDIPHVVRAMDNVTDRTWFPLTEQEAEAKSKRRMGLGVTGLANAAEALGLTYGTRKFIAFQESVLKLIANECYAASAYLAKEKGTFPLYEMFPYMSSPFVRQLDEETRDLIRRYGIRNSHLTSIAPTGTISFCADNISSGIEPVFSYTTQRPVNTPSGQVIHEVEDYGYRNFGVKGKLTDDVTADEHVAVLTTASRWVDSAVSKTCNVDGKMPWDQFKNIYKKAWEGGAKGCTTFNKDGKRFALLTSSPKKEESESKACTFDPSTGQKECA
jgi:ribonucleoside-diphosphate reductase alpha chain